MKSAGRRWFKLRNPIKILFNSFIITLLRYFPSSGLKNFLYRSLLGVKIGKRVVISPDVILDPLFPELIEIGDDTLIGWGARIFTHEFSINKVKIGKIKIGKKVLVGGFSLVRPDIIIEDNVFIASHSYVNKNVKKNSIVGGIPIKKLKKVKRGDL
ncbi:MAG: acyltransferase [Candidatus Aenigmatarchaeota archaeon]